MMNNTKYSFWWTPKPVTCRRSTRAQASVGKSSPIEPYRNVMYDKRVIRGSNYGVTSIELDVYKAAEWRRRNVLRKKVSQRNQRNVLGTPPPVRGRCHEIIQTEKYLEELFDHPPQRTIDTQTDLFLEPPPSPPPYIPSKVGIDVGTSIEPGDLEPEHTFSDTQKEDEFIEQFVAACLLDAAREMELEMIFSFSETTEQPEPENMIGIPMKKGIQSDSDISSKNGETSEEVAKIVDTEEILVTIINEIIKRHCEAHEATTEQSNCVTENSPDEENKHGTINEIKLESITDSPLVLDIHTLNGDNDESSKEAAEIVDVEEIIASIINEILKQLGITGQDQTENIIETQVNESIRHEKEKEAKNLEDGGTFEEIAHIVDTEGILVTIVEEIGKQHDEAQVAILELSESITESKKLDTMDQEKTELVAETLTTEESPLEAVIDPISGDNDVESEELAKIMDVNEILETIFNHILVVTSPSESAMEAPFDETHTHEENIVSPHRNNDEASEEIAQIVNTEEIFAEVIERIIKLNTEEHAATFELSESIIESPAKCEEMEFIVETQNNGNSHVEADLDVTKSGGDDALEEVAKIVDTEEILEEIINEILKKAC